MKKIDGNVEEKKPLGRRTFLAATVAAGVGAGVGASAFPSPAIASGKREWKMVMTWQKALPGLGTGAVRLAKRITSLSEGKLTVKPYGGGELVPPMQVFDAVSRGTAQMGHSASYYWLNKTRASAFFTAVPGGMTAQEHKAWLYFGGGQKLWDELYKPFGIRAFPSGNTGAQMGGWFNREIHEAKDIKGLKMRMPGLAGEVLNQMGGSSQVIPPQELYTAMESGRIDALEWVGAWNDMSLGFQNVSKYYYGPGFHEGGATLELMVNIKAFDSLPSDLKRIVKVACATENELMAAEYYANNVRSFAILRDKHQVDIRPYPEKVLKEFYSVAKDVVSSVGGDSDISKRIHSSYESFRKKSMDMGYVAEQGYMNSRALVG